MAAHALVIDTGSNVVINSGTLEATGSGGLIVNSDISNSGLIWAYGGDITINGTVTGTGGAMITGSSTLEFAAASSVNVTFDGDGFGMLVLDNPTAYTGQIFGFTGTDVQHSDLIDLKGIAFDEGTTWTYYDDTGLNTGGTLTIYDTINGVTTAVDSVSFGDGEYTTANFKLMSDGNGGTLIADPPADPGTATTDLDASSETAAGSQLAEASGNSWISTSGACSLGEIIAAAAQTSNSAAIVSAVLHELESWFETFGLGDQFDFGHLDTNLNPKLLQWPTETVLHAPSEVPLATLGIDNLGRDISSGTLVTSNVDHVSNQASGPFVFNSTFAENSTSGLETAQTIVQADETVFQAVADVLTQAAQAAPEAGMPIEQAAALVAGVQPDKPLTDFHVHG